MWLLVITPFCRAAEDVSSQDEQTEEIGSLLKFITENASSISLINEIAEVLKKEEADIGIEEEKKSLRWGGTSFKLPDKTSTTGLQSYSTDIPQQTPLGEKNPQTNNVYSSNNVDNANDFYLPDVYQPYVDNPPPQAKDVVQNYVDHVLTRQNVPVLLLHVSLSGVQHSDKSLLVSFPINVNFENEKREAIDQWKGWDFNSYSAGSMRPTSMPLRDSEKSAENDVVIAKAIVEKIKKSKPGRMLFTDLAKRNKTDS